MINLQNLAEQLNTTVRHGYIVDVDLWAETCTVLVDGQTYYNVEVEITLIPSSGWLGQTDVMSIFVSGMLSEALYPIDYVHANKDKTVLLLFRYNTPSIIGFVDRPPIMYHGIQRGDSVIRCGSIYSILPSSDTETPVYGQIMFGSFIDDTAFYDGWGRSSNLIDSEQTSENKYLMDRDVEYFSDTTCVNYKMEAVVQYVTGCENGHTLYAQKTVDYPYELQADETFINWSTCNGPWRYTSLGSFDYLAPSPDADFVSDAKIITLRYSGTLSDRPISGFYLHDESESIIDYSGLSLDDKRRLIESIGYFLYSLMANLFVMTTQGTQLYNTELNAQRSLARSCPDYDPTEYFETLMYLVKPSTIAANVTHVKRTGYNAYCWSSVFRKDLYAVIDKYSSVDFNGATKYKYSLTQFYPYFHYTISYYTDGKCYIALNRFMLSGGGDFGEEHTVTYEAYRSCGKEFSVKQSWSTYFANFVAPYSTIQPTYLNRFRIMVDEDVYYDTGETAGGQYYSFGAFKFGDMQNFRIEVYNSETRTGKLSNFYDDVVEEIDTDYDYGGYYMYAPIYMDGDDVGGGDTGGGYDFGGIILP